MDSIVSAGAHSAHYLAWLNKDVDESSSEDTAQLEPSTEEEDISTEQIRRDVMFGILKDWTCIVAGLQAPWTGNIDPFRREQMDLLEEDVPSDEDCIALGTSMIKPHATLLGHGSRCGSKTIYVAVVESGARNSDVRRDFAQTYSETTYDTFDTNPENKSIGIHYDPIKVTSIPTDECWVPQRKRRQFPSSIRMSSQSGAASYQTSLSTRPGKSSAFSMSELIPPKFSPQERLQILAILRHHIESVPQDIVGELANLPLVSFSDVGCNLSPGSSHPRSDSKNRSQSVQPEDDIHPSKLSTDQRCLSPLQRGIVPIEIFNEIAKYLDARDLQSLMFTCKESNRKVGPIYFRELVLTFGTQTFTGFGNEADSTTRTEATQESGDANQASEGNVFKNWGRFVNKFGFAMEADLAEVATAFEKPVLDTCSSFYDASFGWPVGFYQQNPSNEMLEMTARQRGHMTDAMSYLVGVTELALCMDNGLGYLEGRDTSDRAMLVQDKHQIFGSRFSSSKEEKIRTWLETTEKIWNSFPEGDRAKIRRYFRDVRLCGCDERHVNIITNYILTHPRGQLQTITLANVDDYVGEAMLQAGLITKEHHVNEWKTAMELLLAAKVCRLNDHFQRLQGEHESISKVVDGHYTQSTHGCHWTQTRDVLDIVSSWNRNVLRPRIEKVYNQSIFPLAIDRFGCLMRSTMQRIFTSTRDGSLPLMFNGLDFNRDIDLVYNRELENADILDGGLTNEALHPALLTSSQLQWLNEIGWAYQEFLSSYIASVITNKTQFESVRIFNLTKISSAYLENLTDRTLWQALANLDSVTIMVCADWREIATSYPGTSSSVAVSPSLAATKFNSLLEMLAEKASVRTLKIGYVGGGENAIGIWARNQHLLPAPIVSGHRDSEILILPYVECLTLVNCWMMPDVLKTFAQRMTLTGLHTLKLESFSLLYGGGKTKSFLENWSASFPSEIALPNEDGLMPPFFIGFRVPQPGVTSSAKRIVQTLVALNHESDGNQIARYSWLQQEIHPDSWVDVLETLTPGKTLALKRYEHSRDELARPDLSNKDKMPRVTSLEMVSCGYCKLPFQVISPDLHEAVHVPSEDAMGMLKQRKEMLMDDMLQSDDRFLASIVTKMTVAETLLLRDGLGMEFGWGNDPRVLLNAEDLQPLGGSGRFSGVLKAD